MDLAAEDALLLVAMQPVAEPHQVWHAATELLDELAAQGGFRFLGVFEAPAWQPPLAKAVSPRVVLR
jgi:hypothetical protein